jgi:colanic acid/amylovoran biosynthesis glycosyltransferase
LSSRGAGSERAFACVVSRYPAVSHAFIVREVRALRQRGIDVHTFTIRRPSRTELLSAADRDEDARTFAVLPPRPLKLIASHARALVTHPLRYLGTLAAALRLSPPGARQRLWRVFYFAEAILVWGECRRRGLRHLHAHFANVGSEVALLAARFGGPDWSWSFMMHGSTELFSETPHRLPDKIRGARLVVCNSDFTRAQLMKLVGREEWEKLQVVRCGIDTGKFSSAQREHRGGPLRLLTVGRLVPGKGHALLLEALYALRARGVEVEATFVGDGPERAGLEQLAQELLLHRQVRFAGAVGQDELPEWYARADAFCLPTLAEGLGVVLLEAMASGLPVVSTRVMGVPEVVEDGATGLLVSPGRVDELADALERLAASPELCERLGRHGRMRVDTEFALDAATTRLIELFETSLPGISTGLSPPAQKERAPAAAAA